MNIWTALDPGQLINLTILVPLIGAGVVLLLAKHPNLRETASIVTAVVLFTLVLAITDHTFNDVPMAVTWGNVVPGMDIAFAVEPLGVLFALVASFLWIITTIYAIGYMRGHKERKQTRFFMCFALAISTVMAICFSANLFTLFIFY